MRRSSVPAKGPRPRADVSLGKEGRAVGGPVGKGPHLPWHWIDFSRAA
jgi:hypothetical protein